jgi:hypothetical protein
MTEESENTKNLFKEIWIPILSLVIALVSVLSATYNQHLLAESNLFIKKYEITYPEKRKAYADLMASLDGYLITTLPGKNEEHSAHGLSIEKSYYLLHPFLGHDIEIIDKQFRDLIFSINKVHASLAGKAEITPAEYIATLMNSVEIQNKKADFSSVLRARLFENDL